MTYLLLGIIFCSLAVQDTTYTVTWDLVEWVQTPCPDTGKTDEYGIKTNMSCGGLHIREERIHKEKIFNTEADADRFIGRMPTEGLGIFTPRCENAKKIKNIPQRKK